MTEARRPRAIASGEPDDIIARKAADLIEGATASGTLAVDSDIATAVRERRLEDALTLQRAAFRARMLGGINRARSGFDRDQRLLLDMADERRGHRRSVVLLTIGKIVVERTDHDCVVRDLSEGGAGIACDAPLRIGQAATLTMRGLPPTPARVRWFDGKFGGVQFDRVQDQQVILAVALRRDIDQPRAPRLALDTTVTVSARGQRWLMVAADISAGGVKLRGACDLPIGRTVELRLEALVDAITGTICWVQPGVIGVRFAQMLTRAQMEAIAADPSI